MNGSLLITCLVIMRSKLWQSYPIDHYHKTSTSGTQTHFKLLTSIPSLFTTTLGRSARLLVVFCMVHKWEMGRNVHYVSVVSRNSLKLAMYVTAFLLMCFFNNSSCHPTFIKMSQHPISTLHQCNNSVAEHSEAHGKHNFRTEYLIISGFHSSSYLKFDEWFMWF